MVFDCIVFFVSFGHQLKQNKTEKKSPKMKSETAKSNKRKANTHTQLQKLMGK